MKRIAGVLGVPSRSDLGEGRVGIATLDRGDTGQRRCRPPRGQRGRHVRTERQRKPGTTRGSPRRSRTAKASRISRPAVKSRCAGEGGGGGRLSEDGLGQHHPDPSGAGEGGGGGRLSEDGLGQHHPDPSEGPWGGGRPALHGGASSVSGPAQYGTTVSMLRCTKGDGKPAVSRRMPGAGLSLWRSGKAPPDRP